MEAWLLPHPAPPQAPIAHDNDLHAPGNASSGHSYQEVLLWEAPDSFLGNKVIHLFQMWSFFCHENKLKLAYRLTLTVSSQLGSYGGFLNYSLVYDVPLDNEDRSLPAHSDVVITVTEGTPVTRWEPPTLTACIACALSPLSPGKRPRSAFLPSLPLPLPSCGAFGCRGDG